MKPYKQTTRYTSASSALLMVLNHFDSKFELSRDNEFWIWQRSATLPTRGSSIYALGTLAAKKGISVSIIVEEPEYKFPGYRFKAYKKKEIDVANFRSELFYKQATKENIKIEERDFELTEVKDLLCQGKLLMVRLIVGILRQSKLNRRNPHYVLITNYDSDKKEFKIIDTRKGKLKISEELMIEAFETVHTCKRDNRMIIFG
ncbi:hypothetical protein HN587_04875 [Candidatus Woesearchaeota archaeon]|jgi:hypothetical protein|nr:hypothetical protein [Candidatus Woesearchaeota archaeon]